MSAPLIKRFRELFRSGPDIPAVPQELDEALHDLRHLLSRARDYFGRMSAEPDLCKRGEWEEKLGRCIMRAGLLADSAMLGSEIETRTLAPIKCSINQIAQEVIDELAPLVAGTGISVRAKLQPGLPDVQIDPSIFPSVISNLLDNGMRYSGNGGEVVLSTVQDGETVILEVADNGPGIAEEDLARLFDKRFRGGSSAGISGSGIGLYLVNQIVARHNGQISLRTKELGGTVFSVKLPVATALTSDIGSKNKEQQAV